MRTCQKAEFFRSVKCFFDFFTFMCPYNHECSTTTHFQDNDTIAYTKNGIQNVGFMTSITFNENVMCMRNTDQKQTEFMNLLKHYR